LYLVLLRTAEIGVATVGLTLALLGLFYAATEGVLAAMASVAVPRVSRATGIALVATLAGVGKLISSVAFGWMWETLGALPSLMAFGAGLTLAVMIGVLLLRSVKPRVPA